MMYSDIKAIYPKERHLYGSKAVHLAKLAQTGFNVPKAITLSTLFTGRIVKQDYTLLAEDKEALADIWDSMNSKSVAVRSSGTMEDLADDSFAGQYDTVLDVDSYEGLEETVLKCIKSSFSDHVTDYCKKRLDRAPEPVAVIIQQMVQGDRSGVLFTVNPLSQNRDEMMISAATGYGFGVVDGTAETDSVIVSKSSISGQYKDLCNTALSIETLMQQPQDIEWVQKDEELFILQTRDITTLYPVESHHLNKDKLHLYVCYNSVIQGTTAPYTPLGYDFWRCTFAGYTGIFYSGKKKIMYPGWIPYINGRIYYDLTEILGRRFLGKQFLGGFDNKDPEGGLLLKELYQLHRNTFLKQGGKFRLSFGIVKWGLSLTKFGKISRTDINRGLQEALNLGETYLSHLKERISKCHTVQDKITLLEDVTDELLTLGFKQVMYMSYGLKALAKWEKWFAKHYPDIDLDPLKLALPNNTTTQMGIDLMKLALELKKQGIEPTEDEILVQTFLNTYGHRSDYDTDMGQLRWYEAPEPVLNLLRHYMNADLAEDGLARHANQQQEGASLLDYIYATVKADYSKKLADKIRFDLDNYRILAGLRELPKFNMVKALALLREMFLKTGDDMVNKQQLINRNDIAYLHTADLLKIDTLDVKSLVEERKAIFQKQSTYEDVPRIILSTGEVFTYPTLVSDKSDTNDHQTEYTANPSPLNGTGSPNQIQGTPLASGKVKGRIRILNAPEPDRIGPEDILVTHNTDPSWTPLFPAIKGLIMESGGPISHGAIAAREYGLPAIGGVSYARDRFKDGDMVEMDGKSGIIVIK